MWCDLTAWTGNEIEGMTSAWTVSSLTAAWPGSDKVDMQVILLVDTENDLKQTVHIIKIKCKVFFNIFFIFIHLESCGTLFFYFAAQIPPVENTVVTCRHLLDLSISNVNDLDCIFGDSVSNEDTAAEHSAPAAANFKNPQASSSPKHL